MPEAFEILDHTADVGVRAHGRDLAELYENAARGMLHVLVDGESVRAVSEERVEVSGSDGVDLLVAWLHEILFRFDAHGRVFAEVRVHEVTEWRLSATLRGETIDHARHTFRAEIKGVPYHAARVERTAGGWIAEVLLDL